jgi:hypothetical protein
MSQQINLFNPVFLKPKQLFSALTMAQALLAIGVGMAVLSGYSLHGSQQAQKEAAAISIQAQKLQEQMIRLVDASKPVVSDKNLETEVARMQAVFDAKSRILDFIRRGRPADVHSHGEHLMALSRSALPDVWLTRFTLRNAGADIEIEGRALQPAQVVSYVKGLSRDEVFRGKSFGNMSIHGEQEKTGGEQAAEKKPGTPPRSVEFVLKTSDAMEGSAELTGEKTR